MNGIEYGPTCTKNDVKGRSEKMRIAAKLSKIDSLFLFRETSPTMAADIEAGRKSSPRKMGGAPVKKAIVVPKAIEIDPSTGASKIP